MVDPMKKTIVTYVFHAENDTDIHMYTFEDKVPLSVYDGDLVIDFREITEYYSFIPQE